MVKRRMSLTRGWFLPVATLLLILISQRLEAQEFKVVKSLAKVKGETSTASYVGESSELEGTLNISDDMVRFELPLETLKTGNSTRDGHMYETLETEQFPDCTFEGRIVSGELEKGTRKDVVVKGDFTIHGKTRSIKVEGTVIWEKEELHINASFSIKITDFGMEQPGFLFMTVHDEHQISVFAVLKE